MWNKLNKTVKAIIKSQENGVTLIEVLISIAIIALVAAPMLNIFISSTENITLAKQRTDATYVVQEKMEEIISLNYYSLLEKINSDFIGLNGNIKEIPVDDIGYENMYYTVEIKPSGAHYDIYGNNQNASFVHVIFDVDELSSDVEAYILAPNNLTRIIENVSGQLVLPIGGMDYSDSVSDNLIYVLNISNLKEETALISVNISAYQNTSFPGMVIYSKTPSLFDNISITPNPGSSKLRTYLSGADYDKMLVEVEIKAFLQKKSGSEVLLASIKNTVPMQITE